MEMDCVQMTDNGEWKRLTPGFCPGGDERLVLLTDKNREKRKLKSDCEAILIGYHGLLILEVSGHNEENPFIIPIV